MLHYYPNVGETEHTAVCNHIIFVEIVDTDSGTLGNFHISVWYIFYPVLS